MTRAEYVYCNGEILSSAEARVSATDRGFLYGDALFETLRTYGGRPYQLNRHTARLERSCGALGFPAPPPLARVEEILADLLPRTGAPDAYLRITFTRGVGGRGPVPPDRPEPLLHILARPFDPYPEDLYRNGVTAILADTIRHRSEAILRHKTTNYLANILERQRASAAGAFEALFTDDTGSLAEGTISNVFLVEGDRLVTPAADGPLLAGVAREQVLRLAVSEGIPCAEERIAPDRARRASEAFLTNSLMEVLPLVRVEGTPIGSGQPGEMTRRLARLYRQDAAGIHPQAQPNPGGARR